MKTNCCAVALVIVCTFSLFSQASIWHTDFSEYPVGRGIPDGWSLHHGGSQYEIARNPSRLIAKSTASGPPLLVWDTVGEIEGDIEVAVLVRQPDSTLPEMPTTRFQIHLQASTDTVNSYLVDYTGSRRDGLRIRRQIDDSGTTLSSSDQPFAMHIWHHVVFQRRGDMLRAKMWPYHTPEPDAWHLEINDTSRTAGHIGIGFFSDRVAQEYAWFSVSTDTETIAPRAPDDLPGIPHPVVPDTPVVNVRTDYGAVFLSWDPAKGADHYEIRRDGEHLLAHGWEITAFADTTLGAGATATYQVRGISVLKGVGDWSNPAEALLPPIRTDLTLLFETEPDQPWTTHEEELAFLEALANASPRFDYHEIGRSGEGRPLHLVRIGLEAPPEKSVPSDRPLVLLVGGNHGNEPAGRQGVLFMIRKLALSEDPEVLAWLNSYSVIAVPTMNPDGRVANTRRLRVPRIDSNRDMLALRSSETRVIAAVLRDFRPIAMVDAHEWHGSSGGHQRGEFEISTAGNANAHPTVLALSAELAFDRIMQQARTSAGFRSHPYQELYGQPTRVRQIGPLKHAVTILTESGRRTDMRRLDEAGLARDALITRNRRVASQRFALSETMRFLFEHKDRVLDAHQSSVHAALTNQGPLHTRGDMVDLPQPEDTLNPPPFGWMIRGPIDSNLSTVLAYHAIQKEARQLEDGTEVYVVPATQWSRPIAMIALDPESPYQLEGIHTIRLYEDPSDDGSDY